MSTQQKSASLVTFLTLLLLAGSRILGGELIVNGSFEFPNVGPNEIAELSPGSEPDGFGWKVDFGTVEVLGYNDLAPPGYPRPSGPAFDGQQFLDINGISVGGLSQSFPTTPGANYKLTFEYGNNYAHTGVTNPAVTVVHIVDTTTSTELVNPLSVTHGTSVSTNLDWTQAEVGFIAIGNATTLRFVSRTTADQFGGTLLDAISVVPVSEVLNATIRVSQVEVCWNSQTGVLYQPQYRSVLTTNVWTALGSPVPGNGSTNCITDAVLNGEPARFYRVVTPP
jgi:hypothetical protein